MPARMCCCRPHAWGEKDGTVTNSERRISRQRAFLPLPGEAQAGLVDRQRRWPSAWASAEAFAYRSAADMFREHAALSAVRERRHAAISIIGGLRRSRRRGVRRAGRRCNGRRASRRRRGASASSPTAASSRRTARRALSPPNAPALARQTSDRLSAACSTPAACATSGTP